MNANGFGLDNLGGGDLICVNEQNESLWHLLGTLVGSMQGIQKNEGVGTFFLMTKC